MPRPPWKLEIGLDPVVRRWVDEGTVRACLTADRTYGPEPGDHGPIPERLHPGLRRALAKRGIASLYQHQVDALEATWADRHLVVATPTASGKSLCFHLPVLDALARDPSASALYLYPTKALSRDQEANLTGLIGDAELGVPAVVYDGDTPADARRAARQRSPIVMTNPDMLHAGILPHHANWARTFQNLRYVVIDELHTYRGVFGSHVAHVIARLKRVAEFHGAHPRFVCATATIGNPKEHASRMLGLDPETVTLLDESGAPRGGRRVFMYNPPVVNAELGIRGSYLKAAVRLAADLVRARVPTIVFGPSRNSVEIMLKYLRAAVRDDLVRPPNPSPARPGTADVESAIVAYRGGYLPDTRRRIERGLREGKILCVVATNALELGIDIGELDAVICASYPGSIAETWQRFGRAGRRGEDSIAVLITASHALDQYFARNPDDLLEGAIEHARIDPNNTEILVQHLKCAAFELPFVEGERFSSIDAGETDEALGFLEAHGVVHRSGGRAHWATDAYPANHVSLRSVGWDNYVIIDVDGGRALAELDWRATHTMLHEQAIYQHDGEQYQVERLDYDNHKAYVRKVEPDYFTTALTNRRVSIIEVTAQHPLGASPPDAGGLVSGAVVSGAVDTGTVVGLGDVSVIEKVVGYKKIKFFTHENAGYGDVRLPDMQMHTTSFWWTIPERICGALTVGGAKVGRAVAIDGLRGVGHALETVATVALMCDPRDIGQTIGDQSQGGAVQTGAAQDGEPAARGEPRPSLHGAANDVEELGPDPRYDPTVFLFDNVPGGVGLAERIHERSHELLERTYQLLCRCGCASGCPSCVGATADDAPSLRKRAALSLLETILDKPARPDEPSPREPGPREPGPREPDPREPRSGADRASGERASGDRPALRLV